MNVMPFKMWLPRYIAFKQRAAKICAGEIPTEHPQLMRESQQLAALRWDAEGYRSQAMMYFELAKKAKQNEKHEELWACEDAIGSADTIKSRDISVGRHLGQLGGK